MTTKPVTGSFNSVGDAAWAKSDGASIGSVNATTGVWSFGPSSGLGTSSGAYHKYIGSVVGLSGTPVLSGNTAIQFGTNFYRDGAGVLKALVTTSGVTLEEFLNTGTPTAQVWGLFTNTTSQTADTAVAGSFSTIASAKANGGFTFGNSSSGTGHVFYSGGAVGGYVDASSTAALNNDAQVGFRVATSGSGQRAALSAARSTASGAPGVGLLEMVATDTNNYYLWVNAGTWYTGSTYANIGGTTGTVVGSQTSDERLKSNIRPTPYGLETVLHLEPINFVMDGKSKVGFSAQRTRTVLPEAVYSTGDAIKEGEENKLAMEYAQIIPVLVKAIQELKADLDVAKARITELEGA